MMGYYSSLEGEMGFKGVKDEEYPALTEFLYDHFGFSKDNFVLKDGQVQMVYGQLIGNERKMYDLEERLLELKNNYQLTHLSLERYGEETGDFEQYNYDSEKNVIGVYHPQINYKLTHELK